MDLIPKPDQVVSAASNVAHAVLYGGLADLRKMPRTLIDDGTLRELYHYRPVGKVKEDGDPVLLVMPLAAPSSCFDLRRGCSLVEHLVAEGRPTYLVEYGEVSFKDRNLGMEHWIDEVIPAAIRETSAHAGGRPVHVVGWSLGGLFAVLTAADQPDLPIASLSLLGSPFDVSKVPMIAPLRPLFALADRPLRGFKKGNGPITRIYRTVGGAPKPLVRWAFQLSSAQKLITKPLVKLQRLDDTDFLAQLEAVDAFVAQMYAYPGRTFGQLYHRFIKSNDLRRGLLRARRPPDRAVRDPGAGADLRRNHRRHRADPVRARRRTPADRRRGGPLRGGPRWPPRDAHRPRRPRHDLAGPRRVVHAVGERPFLRREVTRGESAAKPSRNAIGANPTRRYGSGGSRSLAR